MIRNVIFPLMATLTTSGLTIYFWRSPFPFSLIGLVGFMALGVSAMYMSYFISYKVFPNENNKPLPRLKYLLSEYFRQKDKKQIYTRGGIWGTVCCMLLLVFGVMAWFRLEAIYSSYELKKYGKPSKAVIVSTGKKKGFGTYREFKFTDAGGKDYFEKFSNKDLNVGDSIEIIYSINRPVINKIISSFPKK